MVLQLLEQQLRRRTKKDDHPIWVVEFVGTTPASRATPCTTTAQQAALRRHDRHPATPCLTRHQVQSRRPGTRGLRAADPAAVSPRSAGPGSGLRIHTMSTRLAQRLTAFSRNPSGRSTRAESASMRSEPERRFGSARGSPTPRPERLRSNAVVPARMRRADAAYASHAGRTCDAGVCDVRLNLVSGASREVTDDDAYRAQMGRSSVCRLRLCVVCASSVRRLCSVWVAYATRV